jgi:putative flippase GtrA
LLVANLAAIASCSAANFALAASWVFAQPRQPHPDASAVR